MDAVPIIDFSAYSLDRESPDPERFQKLIDNVHQALSTIGFMYLKNFGIPAQKIQDAFSYSKKFFALPLEEKMRYEIPGRGYTGYKYMENERLDLDVPHKDLKEAFNYTPDDGKHGKKAFPDYAMPEFKSAMIDLFNAMIPFNFRVLEIMARGLKLEDPQFFADSFKLVGTDKSNTTMRTAYYPPLEGVQIKEGQLRCGEHSDFGAITMLYQSQPGLEVKNVHGEWISAPPIEDTVLVNIGDLMQRWTTDKLIATKHRVVIPTDPIHMRQERQSVIFFGVPDDEYLIKCIDHSTKYPPITTLDYIMMQYNMRAENEQSPTNEN